MKPIEYQCDLCGRPMEYSIESGKWRHSHFIDLLRCKKEWSDAGLDNSTNVTYHIYAKAIPVFPSQGKRGLVIRTCH